ncbi:MAG: right-handed parallel beta-helix repeat-containing protein [Planctomycetota bacterium]|nr:right-handed parallel beta-helix repeat-containing protein [Planctomycetota bacterium]
MRYLKQLWDRRHFTRMSLGLLATAGLSADDRPTVRNPRATSGDRVQEPDWNKRLTITVGPKDGDLVGQDDKVLQAAVEYVARWGGGTVQVLPGHYVLRNAIHLRSGVRLRGSGADSVITKLPSETIRLSRDSDWYDQEITLEKAGGFRLGDAVCLKARNPHNGEMTILKRTFIARQGNRFKLDRPLRKNFWISGEPTASSLFPLVSGEGIERATVENLTLDGNGRNNQLLDGNHAGCLFFQDCGGIAIREVEARNFNGDGISWQICHDVLVENCFSHDNTNLGLHPGSGSQRPVMQSNRLERNSIGIFWCWGVKFGVADGNRIRDNRDYGISIGHNDTDNLMKNNQVIGSGKVGILFRDDPRGRDFWPHRNRLEKNRILDNGGESGIGVDLRGKTKDIQLVDNLIRESRPPANRIGIRIGASADRVQLDKNRIEGFEVAIRDLRS